jgi:hypothetical protein
VESACSDLGRMCNGDRVDPETIAAIGDPKRPSPRNRLGPRWPPVIPILDVGQFAPNLRKSTRAGERDERKVEFRHFRQSIAGRGSSSWETRPPIPMASESRARGRPTCRAEFRHFRQSIGAMVAASAFFDDAIKRGRAGVRAGWRRCGRSCLVSPSEGDAVAAECRFLPSDQCHLFFESLRDEQAVERISMTKPPSPTVRSTRPQNTSTAGVICSASVGISGRKG